MKPDAIIAIAIAVAPIVAGVVSSLMTARYVRIQDAYAGSPRPPGSPPAWVFGPVWTVLYALMGAAAAGYYLRAGSLPWTFWAQLLLNASWTPVFFAARRAKLALLILAATLVLAAAAALHMYRRVRWTGLCLVPYLAWLAFAGYLNAWYAWYVW
jgi:benzodiazapine receptor